jgi:hypothetical protein
MNPLHDWDDTFERNLMPHYQLLDSFFNGIKEEEAKLGGGFNNTRKSLTVTVIVSKP